MKFPNDIHPQPCVVDTQQLSPLPKNLTYATVIDVRNVEHEITEFMVRRACEEVESLQQFPFAPRR